MLNKEKNKHSFPASFTDGTNNYTTPPQVANTFNDYLTNIGLSLAAKIPSTSLTAEQLSLITQIPIVYT